MKGKFTYQRAASGMITITPLLDALTIILVFMLANYSEKESVDPEGIKLPTVSISSTPPLESEFRSTVPVFLRQNSITIAESKFSWATNSLSSQEDEQITKQVKAKLSSLRLQRIQSGQTTPLLIRAESQVPFEFLNLILDGASKAGVTDIRFLASEGTVSD